MSRFPWPIVLGALAALANIAGGYIISTQKQLNKFLLRLLIALGAGFMLAAAFLEVIPKSFRLMDRAPLVVLAGYLFVQWAEHTLVAHFHFGEETHTEAIINSSEAYTAVFGLMLHTFFDGVLIASGFFLSMKLGFLLFFAIILHKIPEGFTAASIMRASGYDSKIAQRSAYLVALATMLGVLSIMFMENWVRYALPFSAGVTLYVAASDLIPEVNRERGVWVSVMVFVGVLFYFATDYALVLLTEKAMDAL
ncbi:MAG: ZIP family metal transporter [Acidobacteria bacterium]|nr:ZIP family metal transporter [Acidobacteriota bacterium]MBI3656503.1 ZIP family metal transporter [Acidobacteriota bacterium]